MRPLLHLAALSCLGACATAPVAPPPLGEPWLAEVVESARRSAELPALGAVVVGPGGAITVAVSGLRASDAASPVALDDAWQLGSITKTFTSSIVGQLVDAGSLAWDAPLSRVFPEANLSGPVGRVTLRALAEHSSGLPRDPHDGALERDPARSPMERRRALVAALAGVTLGEPRFAYSNLGFHVLGAAAERASGMSWEALIDDRIARPSGVDIVLGEPRAHTPDAPAPHVWRSGRYTPVPPRVGDVVYDTLAPAGHVSMRLADYGRILRSTIAAGRGGAWVPSWFVGQSASGLGRQLAHDGSNGRNFARAVVYPDADLALAVTCNCAGGPRLDAAVRAVHSAILARRAPSVLPVAEGGVIEGEALAVTAWSGDLAVQSFGGLSGGRQLWWTGARAGDRIVLRGRAAVPGRQRVIARLCFAPDYGEVEVTLGPTTRALSGRAPQLEWRDVELGIVEPVDGVIELAVRARSDSGEGGVVALLGLDVVRLEALP